MVSVLASSAVDRGLEPRWSPSVLASSAVDRGLEPRWSPSVFASSAVDRGLEPRLSQTKYYNIVICCFSAAPRSKNRDWLAWNQDYVSERSDMSPTRGLLLQ
jgi:hypothetical protein